MKSKVLSVKKDVPNLQTPRIYFSALTKQVAAELQNPTGKYDYKVLPSNPNGFIKEALPLSLFAAHYYKRLIKSEDPLEILEHIKALVNFIRDNHQYSMPLNTSRVLFALNKEALKHKNTPSKMMEYIETFMKAAEGNPKFIRKCLVDLNLIELPEGIPLKDIGLAWDGRVHDSSSAGRKSTIQLILDAYIKGLSMVNISYMHYLNPFESIQYGLEAAKILEIDLSFSIEYSVGYKDRKTTYIIYFPHGMLYKNAFESSLRNTKMSSGKIWDILEENNIVNKDMRIDGDVDYKSDEFIGNLYSALNKYFVKMEYYDELDLLKEKIFSVVTQCAKWKTIEGYNEMHKGEQLYSFFETMQDHAEENIRNLEEHIILFNSCHLDIINKEILGVQSTEEGLTPLDMQDVYDISEDGHVDRIHLGDILHKQYKPLLGNRLVEIEKELKIAKKEHRKGRLNALAVKRINQKLIMIREEYNSLNARMLQEKYFSASILDYNALFPTLDSIDENFFIMHEMGCRLVLAKPLELGVSSMLKRIAMYFPVVSGIEIYNTKDCFIRNDAEINELMAVVEVINRKDKEEIIELFETYKVKISDEQLFNFISVLKETKQLIRSSVASDATGFDPEIPGMGFYNAQEPETRIGKGIHRRNLKGKIPLPIAAKKAKINDLNPNYLQAHNIPFHFEQAVTKKDAIYSLGKESKYRSNKTKIREELALKLYGLWKFPFNPAVRNTGVITAGFIGALYNPELAIGIPLTALWFGITSSRTLIADMLAKAGTKVQSWRTDYFNIRNTSNALFWTGFSIPLLKLVDYQLGGFIDAQNFSEVASKSLKFFGLSAANGLYLFSHNMLRGMGTPIAKRNFFRSILSFPLATIGSYVLDPFLPKVVQAKLWSDVVAGLIEGGVTKRVSIANRDKDYGKLFQQFHKEEEESLKNIRFLDIFYIWARRPGGNVCLKKFLAETDLDKIAELRSYTERDNKYQILEDPSVYPEYKKIKQILEKREEDFKKLLDTSINKKKPRQGRRGFLKTK